MNRILGSTLVYNFLRRIKRSFNCFILPDSIAILKSEQEKIRHYIYTLLNEDYLVLDIGSGSRPVSRFKRVIKIDFGLNCPVDIRGDAHNLPFSEKVFDLVWLGGVLEHIRDPKVVINEIYRILKNLGYIYIEIPFFQKVHGAPNDFQRFTIAGLEELCSQFLKINGGIMCGPSCAFSHILRTYLALCLSFNNKYLYHFFYYYILGWVTLPIKYSDIILSKYKNADTIAFVFYYLGRKI